MCVCVCVCVCGEASCQATSSVLCCKSSVCIEQLDEFTDDDKDQFGVVARSLARSLTELQQQQTIVSKIRSEYKTNRVAKKAVSFS